MVELDQGVSLQLVDKGLCLDLEQVHLGSHFVLSLHHVVTHLVKGVVEHLEDIFDFGLVRIKLGDESLLLLTVI